MLYLDIFFKNIFIKKFIIKKKLIGLDKSDLKKKLFQQSFSENTIFKVIRD